MLQLQSASAPAVVHAHPLYRHFIGCMVDIGPIVAAGKFAAASPSSHVHLDMKAEQRSGRHQTASIDLLDCMRRC